MKYRIALLIFLVILLNACQPQVTPVPAQRLNVMAAESFLADIAQQVAGRHFKVSVLIPDGSDLHTFQPTPKDVVAISENDLFIINGGGLEGWLEGLAKNANTKINVINASEGIEPHEGGHEDEHEAEGHHHDIDPHFWLDPNLVITYVENVEKAFSQKDPANAEDYRKNAKAYIEQLRDLDAYIKQQVDTIPSANRKLVTTHESLGYFADRYGFEVVGAILPGYSSEAEPTAQSLAKLVDLIKASQAKAVFLDLGSNPRLAQQLSAETGIKVVTDLHTHTIAGSRNQTSGYIGMMRYNIDLIASALK